jgi:fumarate hydratase subunit beta
VAYQDLGPEALRELEVVDFPAIVINDAYGNDLYEMGMKTYEIRG